MKGVPVSEQDERVPGLDVYVTGRTEDIDASLVIDGLKSLIELLDELGGGSPHNGWRFTRLATGSVDTAIGPSGAISRSERNAVSSTFERVIGGFGVTERSAAIPPGWGASALRKAQRVSEKLVGASSAGVQVSRPESISKGVLITRRTSQNITSLADKTVRSVGSVTGHLQRLNYHNGAREAFLYDGDGPGVRVAFGADLEEQINAAVTGKRLVRVQGIINRNAMRETQSVSARRLVVIPEVGEGPRLADAAGAFPDFTGGLSVEDYLREIRDAP